MPWLQVKIDTDAEHAAQIEEALTGAGAVSVTYEDAGAVPILEPQPGTMPLWSALRLVALFPGDAEPAHITAALAGTGEASPHPAFERLPDRDWERVWLEDWRPLRFGRHLWVAPLESAVDDPEAVVVRLDPGLAFGTGTHATTALCLEWLEAQSLAGVEVLDYGCGSGILAIAALLLGARAATAVDIDPQALEATRANARVNAVADRLRAIEPEAVPAAEFGVVVANILAGPLVDLAPTLAGYQTRGGRLALAGLLDEQATEVCDAYAPWYRLDCGGQREEWVRIDGVRR